MALLIFKGEYYFDNIYFMIILYYNEIIDFYHYENTLSVNKIYPLKH